MFIFNKPVLEKILGYGACTTISILIDDIFWPIAVLFFGSVTGGLIMTTIALIVNLILIWLYDYLKKDLFGFEKIREIQETKGGGFWFWLIRKALKKGRAVTFIVLSYYDPFLAVIYMRKGVKAFKMVAIDWWYFIMSMIIASVGVTIFWSVIVDGLTYIYLNLL